MKAVILAAIALSALGQDAEKLIQASDCSSCHAVDHEVVGPAYNAVAKRYAGQTDAVAKLAAKIRDGGNGMTPHPDLTDPQRTEIVKWILSQTESAGAPRQSETKTYAYPLKDGTTVRLDFPLFLEGQAPKVTKEVFHGYQLYNSYCYRCHGTDASGSQLAPDLRHSLAAGMNQRGFLSVAMEGNKEQGMPAWAGFLSEDDVIHIFRYVKGRSLDLVSGGRPPSAQD
ncbi:MAG TPA: c-type cytochrome [Bryobacteraceae bacterium]|nr:c-type cytochrome [Bryobacteraceae bacterium]HUO32985.1 c-type cytochrome [Bryobacteraceae bacterium]